MTVAPIRNVQAFEDSIKNFAGWLGSTVSGACDLDFICERAGQFLVIEAKPYHHGIIFGYGQHLLLYRLSQQPNTTLLLIGEGKDAMYLVNYNTSGPPDTFKKGGKTVVNFTPGMCKKTTKKALRTYCENWWNDAKQA